MSQPLERGRVYAAVLGTLGEKYYLVVSNNQRNRNLDSVVAVRLTTSLKPPLPSIVALDPDRDGFKGTSCAMTSWRSLMTRCGGTWVRSPRRPCVPSRPG